MKKLSIALALILCLVMVIFSFAACGKKKGDATTADPGTTPASSEQTTTPASSEQTTAPETDHVHTQGADYVIDTPATCGAAGSKSYHCTVCNEIIPETVVAIPATGNHTLGEWVETTAPTVVSDGVKTKTCSVCGYKETEAVSKTEATIQTWTPETTGKYSNSKSLAAIQGDKHFYPTEDNPDGNDLLVEYSLLWNDSLLNLEPGTSGPTSPYVTTNIAKSDASDENTLTWWSLTNNVDDSWCKFAGGFEAGCLQRVAPDGAAYTPIGMCASGGNYAAYPNIGGSDKDNPEYGWHRFGIRFHQEVVNESIVRAGGAAIYEFTITLYFDGEQVSMLIGKTTADQKVPKAANYLFTAAYDETDGIKYSDNADADRTVFAILVNTMVAKADTVAYWADADFFYTCGKDFVQKVAPSNNAEDTATIELASGVTTSAKAWYKLVDGSATHDHVYNVEGEVTKAATLLENGTKVMKCAYCDETQTVEYEYYPEVFKWDKDARDRYSPNQATLGEIRGDKHFYDAGNDLLIEYSFLWNETTANLRGDKQCYLDSRLTVADGEKGKNIAYWSPSNKINMSDCKYAGSFEYGGIAQNMPDNPYPGFNSGVNDGDLYPNIGGENNGDGTEQRNDLYGWHRISLRYREEVTNKEALMADTTAGATAATYNLELWVYIDGKLVIHAYGTDLIYTENDKPDEDRKLFSAASNGEGGIVYTENDALIMHPVCLNSKRALDKKTAYYSIADVFMTVGSEFTQKVMRLSDPAPAKLTVVGGTTVTSTMWYTPAHEHVWDGNFTVERAATVIRDGVKVEHCSVCGAAHLVDVPFEIQVYDSKNPSGPYATDTSFAYNETIASIRGDKSFAPTDDDDDGNDLWFEYSFLWNDSLYYRDTSDNRAELRIFGFRDMAGWKNYRGFYDLYTRNNNDGFETSSGCPYAGHIDFSTYYLHASPAQNCADDLGGVDKLNGRAIGRYIAGWGAGRNDSPYLWDSKYQTMGGWHRLGFRYHQEVESVEGSTVSYAGYTELYIDGVLCWRVHTNFDPASNDSLNKKGLLLWTATAEDGVITGYTNNDTMGVEFRIDNITGSSRSVFIALDDIQTNCGDGFVHPVVRVENPKPVKITLPDGEEYDGAKYFTYVHDHFWDEDYTVTVEPTMTSKGKKIDHCVVCGETRETVMDETEPIVYVTNWNATQRAASEYSIENPDAHKMTFGFKEAVKDIRADEHLWGGNDLLIEFSFLYNETMANASNDGTLTVMYIENNNLFNINMKTGKINATGRSGDVVLFKADESGNIPIGEYGWHRFAVRIHQDAVNNEGSVKYTVIATAYLDGVKILEVDKTTYALSKHNGSTGYTGLLYTATIEDGAVVCADLPENKHCDVYVMVESIYANENDANAGYVVVGDLNMTAGADFAQNVQAVADPATATLTVAEGVELPAAFYYEFAD